jgi:hypothetical protein
MPMIEPEIDRGGVGVGALSAARAILDLILHYSAASSEIWAAFFPKIRVGTRGYGDAEIWSVFCREKVGGRG